MTVTHLDPSCWINGRWLRARHHTTVTNPATLQPAGEAAEATDREVDLAVTAARTAFDATNWPHLPAAQRAGILRQAAVLYAEHLGTMGSLITAQNGSPIAFAAQTEHPLRILALTAGYTHTLAPEHRAGATITHEPVGVVAVITPWNMPQKTILMKVAPALLAGCTVVVKPAPETPLDALYLAQILDAAGVPPGVFNVVPGGTSTGESLVNSPGVDKVAFTGSTVVGRRIAGRCGAMLRRVTTELGGKSPAILCDDADLDAWAASLHADTFLLSGQICSAHTRVIAPRRLLNEVIDRATQVAEGLTIGDPLDPGTHLGPLIRAGQLDRAEAYLTAAEHQGGTVHGGGRWTDLPGHFMRPAVVTGLDNLAAISRAEVFAPVLSVIPHDGDYHAIDQANDSLYGLEAGVWTTDPDRAAHLASRLRAGTVRINGAGTDLTHPLGGLKQSGIGRELGPEGVEHYREIKVTAGLHAG